MENWALKWDIQILPDTHTHTRPSLTQQHQADAEMFWTANYSCLARHCFTVLFDDS